MKALGKDIKDFYETGFPEGYYHDDNELETHDDKGGWALALDEKHDLSKLGYIIDEKSISDVRSFQSVFAKWLKARDTVTLIVTVPRDMEQTAREQLKAEGYTVA